MLLWCLAKYSATAAVRTYNLHSVQWQAAAIWQGLHLISLESDYHFFSLSLSLPLTHTCNTAAAAPCRIKAGCGKKTKLRSPFFKRFALPPPSNPALGEGLNSYQKLTNPPKLAGETPLTPRYQSHLSKIGLVAANCPSAGMGLFGSAAEQRGLQMYFLDQETKCFSVVVFSPLIFPSDVCLPWLWSSTGLLHRTGACFSSSFRSST